MTEADAIAWVRTHLFTPKPPPESSPRGLIGAEIELLSLNVEDSTVSRLDGRLGAWLDRTAQHEGWRTSASSKGAPKYELPAGGMITLEPGGQVEYSSQPHSTPHALIDDVQNVVASLRVSAADAGIALHTTGIDPFNALRDVPLQLDGARYARMDGYLSSIGEAGPRMMRQTAALQVSVDAPFDVTATWSILNRMAPVLIALCANSRFYAGRDTGYASYRAYTWTQLDSGRTGVFADATDPAVEYARFALDARCMDATSHNAFRKCAGEDWEQHVSTLFPEVRPKGFLEVRCMDSIPIEHIAAPVLMIAAIAGDEQALSEAAALLPAADRTALVNAAKRGLDDPALAALAADLVDVTDRACARAGEEFATAEDVSAMHAWLEHQSRRDVLRSSTTSSATIM